MNRRPPTSIPCLVLAALLTCGLVFPANAQVNLPTFEPQTPERTGLWEPVAPSLPPLESIIAQPVPERPIYGFYCWANEYVKYHPHIKKMGWTSLRLGGVTTDEAIRLCAQDDMEVMLNVGARLKEGESDADFIARWVQDVETRLERWGPGGTFYQENPELRCPVKALEVGNEPNFHYMTGHQDMSDGKMKAVETRRAQLYGQVLKAVGKRIKERWPTVQVVAFGAGGAGSGDVRFLRETHELYPDLAQFYDILSTHPYSASAPLEGDIIQRWGRYRIDVNYGNIRKIMAEFGAGEKPLWYTELGWPIPQGEGGHYPPKDAKDEAGRITANLQAAYIVRGYLYSIRLGAARMMYMSLVDTDTFNSGFMNRDETWRPSAHAVHQVIQVMPRPRLLGAIHDGAEGGTLFAYRFTKDYNDSKSPEVIALWNITGSAEVEIPWNARTAAIYPMTGERQVVQASAGKLKLPVSPYPIYVTQE